MTIEIPVPFVTHKLDKPPSQSVETSKSARPAPRRRGTTRAAARAGCWPRREAGGCTQRAALTRAFGRPTHQVKS